MVDTAEWYLNHVVEAERKRALTAAELAFQTTVATGGDAAAAFAAKQTAIAAAHAAVSVVQAKVATRTTAGAKGK